MPRRRLRSDYICCRLTCYLTFYWKRLAEEFSSEGVTGHWLIFPTGKNSCAARLRLGAASGNQSETENRVGSEVLQTNTSEYLGPIKGYSACPCRPGYSLLRVDAVVRTSQTTGRNGYTQTNSPFDFAGCIPRLPGRFFLIEIS
jgi:hypothetical protein